MSIRTEQVASLIKEIMGDLFTREVEFPEGTLATITRVTIPADLKNASVYVSVLPFARGAEVMNVIRRAQSRLQYGMSKQLTMKFSPRLHFVFDEQPEKAAEIERLIDEERIP